MFKRSMVSTVLILMFTSGAFALVGQTEYFGLGAENLVILSGGPGTASGGNTASVGQGQLATDTGGGNIIAMQNEAGILNQGTSAVGLSGALGALQSAGAGGEQWQLVGLGLGLGLQGQNLALLLGQDMEKNDGVGGTVAGQGVVVGQVQIVATPYGISGDAQFAGVSQFGSIGGGAGSSAVINKDLSVGANQ